MKSVRILEFYSGILKKRTVPLQHTFQTFDEPLCLIGLPPFSDLCLDLLLNRTLYPFPDFGPMDRTDVVQQPNVPIDEK